MEILCLLIFMISAITLSSLRITAIYINRIAQFVLLIGGVLVLFLLVGSANGAKVGLIPSNHIAQWVALCEGLPVFSNLINDVTTIAEYVYNFIISNFSVSCEGFEDLPCAMKFSDLHLTENLKTAKELLADQSGVYCFVHVDSGTMYVGSSTNIGERLLSHIFNRSSNLYLQRAIALYGLSAFTFIVVEFCKPLACGEREQHWLNWLFRLSRSLRYNFNPIAYLPPSFLGKTHSLETRAKMSAAQAGENNPNYGKTASAETRAKMSGTHLGNTNAVRKPVDIYSLDNVLVKSFSSRVAAAKFLGVTSETVMKAIKRNSVVKRLYRVSSRS